MDPKNKVATILSSVTHFGITALTLVGILLGVSQARATVNGGLVDNITHQTLLDNSSHKWIINGGVVKKDGKPTYVSSLDGKTTTQTTAASYVLFYNNNIYYEDNTLHWYKWQTSLFLPLDTVAAAGHNTDPRVASANGTISSTFVVDDLHNVWVNSSGTVYKNGALPAYSSGVDNLIYLNGFIYSHAAGIWYEYDGTSWVKASKANGDPRAIVSKSIKNFKAACDGTTDDSAAVATAFLNARNNSFKLMIDCPLFLNINRDIGKPIFIDSFTTVEFSGSGRIITNNSLIPAFVIANSTNVSFLKAVIEYNGSIPADINWMNASPSAPYYYNGKPTWFPVNPQNGFLSGPLTDWYHKNRGVTFASHHYAFWSDDTNMTAIFFISGDSSHLFFNGMNAYVPSNHLAHQYIPALFSFNPGYKNNASVNDTTTQTQNLDTIDILPHNLVFESITLDGTYFGFVGDAQNVLFRTIRSHRYADLQDASGKNVGGANYAGGPWFAPPHLFYMTFNSDPHRDNANLEFNDVIDYGTRAPGTIPRDVANGSSSGCLYSLKAGGSNVRIDGYHSYRPDGFFTTLGSNGLLMTNSGGTFDSSLNKGLYQGWLFPGAYWYNNVLQFQNMDFNNIYLYDLAKLPMTAPISNVIGSNVIFSNTSIHLNQMPNGAGNDPTQVMYGDSANSAITYSVAAATVVHAQSFTANQTFLVSPSSTTVNQTVYLQWSVDGSASQYTCVASGDWSGNVKPNYAANIKVTEARPYFFILTCSTPTDSVSTTFRVNVN